MTLIGLCFLAAVPIALYLRWWDGLTQSAQVSDDDVEAELAEIRFHKENP